MSENTTPNLQPEVSLPIVPTIGDIDHFRIINKNGQSQKATITQVRELIPYVGENLILGNTSHVGVFSPSDNYAFANRQLKSLKKGVYSFSAAEIQNSIGSPAGYSIIIMDNSFASALAIVQIPTGELSVILNIEQDISNPIILMYSGIAGQTAGNAVNYSCIKLELGTKATPYIPNPADIARAIDYSILTEQVVHGEYWIGVDGVKRQVYIRTIIINGTVAAESNIAGFVVFPNKKYLASISGSYTLANTQYLIGVDYTPTLRKLEIDSPLNNDRVWYNLYSGSLTAELFTIVAAIKYTKQ